MKGPSGERRREAARSSPESAIPESATATNATVTATMVTATNATVMVTTNATATNAMATATTNAMVMTTTVTATTNAMVTPVAAAGPVEAEAPRGRYLLIDSQGLPYTVLVTPGGGGRRLFACAECGRSFAFLSYLQRHCVAHSPHKPHVCRACGKAFKRPSHLRRHRGTHAAPGSPRVPAASPRVPPVSLRCPRCPRRFGQPQGLRRHLRRHHPLPPSP